MAKKSSKIELESFPRQGDFTSRNRQFPNLSNDLDQLHAFHQAMTIDHCFVEPLAVAVQDTTEILYVHANSYHHFHLHAGLAVSVDGHPLGMFDYSIKSPQAKTSGNNESVEFAANESALWLRGIECAAKISAANPGVRVINVSDRDFDFWKMLETAESLGTGLVVRSSDSTNWRIIDSDGNISDLRKHLAEQPTKPVDSLTLEPYGGTRVRTEVKIDVVVQAAEVTLAPPANAPGIKPAHVLAISAVEFPPKEKNNLNWLLLTTERMPDSLSTAGSEGHEIVQDNLHYYALKSRIKSYFETLAAGIRTDRRGHKPNDDLRQRLILDLLIARLVMTIERYARISPYLPAEFVLPQQIIDQMDNVLILQGQTLLEHSTIRDFAINLGRCVGTYPHKNYPYPGIKKLWEGYLRLTESARISRMHNRWMR